MNDQQILKTTPFIFFKKCEQLVHKQKHKFELNFKSVTFRDKNEILTKNTQINDSFLLNDKTVIKPLSISKYDQCR